MNQCANHRQSPLKSSIRSCFHTTLSWEKTAHGTAPSNPSFRATSVVKTRQSVKWTVLIKVEILDIVLILLQIWNVILNNAKYLYLDYFGVSVIATC